MAGRSFCAATLAACLVLLPLPALAADPAPVVLASPLPGGLDNGKPIQLTAEEAKALELGLIAAKPSLSTVTLASFIFPGSEQAYMGHVDHTLGMWGAYLLVYIGSKYYWADTDLIAGQRTSDVVVAGAFMVMATASALDAFFLASNQRAEYDRLINRVTDKDRPEIKYLESVPKP